MTHAEIKDTFEQLGPTPRIIQLLSQPDQLEHYKEQVDTAILDIEPHLLKKLVSDTRSLSMKTNNPDSHKLVLVRRVERDCVHSSVVVAPITDSIMSRLARQLRVVAINEQVDLYNHFSNASQSKKMSGMLFEAIGLRVIAKGLTITLLPMVRLPGKSNAKTGPCWYTIHVPLTDKAMEAEREQALFQSQKIQFSPTTIREFKTDSVLSLVERIFYVPASEMQEALDSFLLLDGILYILQFNVGQNHSIKQGFVGFLQKCQHVPPLEEWKFVFLIPPGLTLLCREPKSQLPGLYKLDPYSAELDLRPYLRPLCTRLIEWY